MTRRQLVRRLLLWQALDECMPVFPVYALLFATNGVGAGGMAGLLVLWSAASNVFEVPSGAWADAVSRRFLLSIAAVVYAAAFATWAVWPTFAGFAVGFVLWALSGALSSGTFQALAYDELTAIGERDAYARVSGLGTTLSLLGMAVATLAAFPLVAAGGFGSTVWVSVAVCVAQLVVVRSLPVASPRTRQSDVGGGVWAAYMGALRSGVAEVVHHAGVRTAVAASASLMGLLAIDEYFGLLLDERGAVAAAVPLWLTLVAAAQAVGAALAERAMAWQRRTFTVLVGGAGSSIVAGALVNHPAGMIGIAGGYGALQLAIVVADVRLQCRIEGGARATVTSAANVLAELLAIVGYVVVGLGAPHVGYGVMLAVIGLPVALLARLAGRALGQYRGDRSADLVSRWSGRSTSSSSSLR